MKVAVLAGGISEEKEVSIRSGQNISQALSDAGIEHCVFNPADSDFSLDILKDFNVVYPILHGTKGEDGAIQGALEFYQIPYVGCGILASASAMDKSFSKNLFEICGVNYPKGFATKGNVEETLSEIKKLGYPVFVKPACQGSSVGALLLHDESEAKKLLPEHLAKFPYSLVETYITGREMTVGIIEFNNELVILPILELKPKAEFYDYETKYTAGMTEFILPAPMDQEVLDRIHEDVRKIFKAFQLKDCVRVDLILTEKNIPIYLEVNTAPGMTETSDIPAMLKEAKIPLVEFVRQMISNAMEK